MRYLMCVIERENIDGKKFKEVVIEQVNKIPSEKFLSVQIKRHTKC